jgi:hypothetical protein
MAGTGRRVVQECLEQRVVDILAAREARGVRPLSIAAPLAARVLASALVGLSSWCVEHGGAETVAAAQETFRALSEGVTRR